MDSYLELSEAHDYVSQSGPKILSYETLNEQIDTAKEAGRRLTHVHIHKTGGHTIRTIMHSSSRKRMRRRAQIFDHNWFSHPLHDRMLFSCIRNPFDWLVSIWEHGSAGHAGTKHNYSSFKSFVMDIHQHGEPSMGYWTRAYRVKAADNMHVMQYRLRWPLRYLQTWQTFEHFEHEDGPTRKCNASFYIRTEHLDHAIPQIWDCKPTRKNVSTERAGRDYREYYDDEMIARVADHREQELKLLGYNFDGPTDDGHVIQVTGKFIVSEDILYGVDRD